MAYTGAILIGSTLLKSYQQINASKATEKALELRSQQEEIAATQKSLQRANQLEQVISTQNANQGASGVSSSSSSFNAIQMDTFNKFAQDEQLANLNLQFQQTAIEQQKQNVNANAWASVATNIFDAGKYYLDTKVPTIGKRKKSPIEDDDMELNQSGVGF